MLEEKEATRKLIKRKPKPIDLTPLVDPLAFHGIEEDLPPYKIYKPFNYRDGPEGFITWCQDMVYIPIYPRGSDIAIWTSIERLPKEFLLDTRKSYFDIWEKQKKIVRHALRMVDGRFIYKLIILCWMRGEGKSLLACLIQLWKFFNWPKQQITLGANSKEQTKFVHYDIMRDIILNSPKLLRIVGKRNIQEKEIRLRDEKGNVASVIKSISSFSGIVSNITGYTFSEIFDMKNPRFFIQLDGSIRNIPNSLGVIDSTVSNKQHILYKLYQSFAYKATKTVFFSHRSSPLGKASDYWNPNMDQSQLDDYRAKFPKDDFDRYFLNTWDAGSGKVFSEEMVEEMGVIGIDGKLAGHKDISALISTKTKCVETVTSFNEGRRRYDVSGSVKKIQEIKTRLTLVDSLYTLKSFHNTPTMASIYDLLKLTEMWDTDWCILCGIDRADPMKRVNEKAKTIVTCMAKGLPGSRSHAITYDEHLANPHYIYVLLHVVDVKDHSLEGLKEVLSMCHLEYSGIDSLCAERWGTWDLAPWCEEEDIKFEPIHPTFDKQRSAFSEFFSIVSTGRFKAPKVYVVGALGGDIVREEIAILDFNAAKKWYGSPEKDEVRGIQDDCAFALAWGLYGGRELTIDDLRERKGNINFGTFLPDKNLLSA